MSSDQSAVGNHKARAHPTEYRDRVHVERTDGESQVPRIRWGPGAGPALEWKNMAVLLTLQASQGLIGPDVAGLSVQVANDEITIHVCLRAHTEAVVEDMDDLVFELEALMAGVVIPMPRVTVVPYVGPLDARWPGYRHRRIFTAHDRSGPGDESKDAR